MVTRRLYYWSTDPALARSIIAFAVTDPQAADLLAGHDAGRLRLLTRMVGRLPRPARTRSGRWTRSGCSPVSPRTTT